MEQENAILKAINALNEKMDNGFVDIKSEVKDIRNTIKVIPEMQSDILKMKNDIAKIQEEIKVMPQMQNDIIDMKRNIRQLSRTVARIEVEHGKKLEALFDAFSMNSEKINSLESKIESCIYRLDKHDDEIYYLKSKI